jgi:adenosylcobinamide-phosphate synthase
MLRRSVLRKRWQIMVLALLLDTVLGDLPNRWHPVAWMGSAIHIARRHAPTTGAAAQFAYGTAVTLAGALFVAASPNAAMRLCRRLPAPLGWLVETALLKQTVALRGLAQAALAVYTPLHAGDENEARRLLAWHLVSRDTTSLDTPRIAAAAIESVAENCSDGVIAPLFYYAWAGLPGALSYRWLNTVDSLWGYRDPGREWLGKAGARGDDVANWLPARLTALLLIAAASLTGQAGQAWRIWRRDANLTASPNAGQPMSAMAGALGVELEKVGQYRLGAGLPLPQAAAIRHAVNLMRAAVVLGMALSGFVLWTALRFPRKVVAI